MSARAFLSFLPSCALSRSLTCPAGQYLSGAACAPCPSGTFTAAPSSASSCTPCAAGLYASAASGSTSCTACAAGLFSAAIGAADVSSCATCAARYATGASAGATACTLCASGQWAAAASTACTSCVAGTSAATPGMADGDRTLEIEHAKSVLCRGHFGLVFGSSVHLPILFLLSLLHFAIPICMRSQVPPSARAPCARAAPRAI
jgi:hypothetical protein